MGFVKPARPNKDRPLPWYLQRPYRTIDEELARRGQVIVADGTEAGIPLTEVMNTIAMEEHDGVRITYATTRPRRPTVHRPDPTRSTQR